MRYVISLAKAGPYIGPRGGKWADPEHKIPYREPGPRMGKAAFKKEMDRRRQEGCIVKGSKTYKYKEIIKLAGGIWDSWQKQWLVPSREIAQKLRRYMDRNGPITRSKKRRRPAEEVIPLEPPFPQLFTIGASSAPPAPRAGQLRDAEEAHVEEEALPSTEAEVQEFWKALIEAGSIAGRHSVLLNKLGLLKLIENPIDDAKRWRLTADGMQQLRRLNKLELSILLDAVRSIGTREQRREDAESRHAREAALLDLEYGRAKIALGEGYGGRPFVVGEVLEDPMYGVVTVVEAGKRYIAEEGMSLGVGLDAGNIYWARVRRSTPEEIQEFLRRKAARQQARRKVQELSSLGEEIRQRGEMPVNPTIEGERLFDTENIYGGGDWFVAAPDRKTVWYIMNNGMDGDDWSRNNVGRPGRAGAIGWRLVDADAWGRLMDLAQRLNGRERGPSGKWEPPDKIEG